MCSILLHDFRKFAVSCYVGATLWQFSKYCKPVDSRATIETPVGDVPTHPGFGVLSFEYQLFVKDERNSIWNSTIATQLSQDQWRQLVPKRETQFLYGF